MLKSEVRDKMVLALVSTTREQCKRAYAVGEARCAIGVITEGFGFVVYSQAGAPQPNISRVEREITEALGTGTLSRIVRLNDIEGKSFDEIAKWLKEQPVED